MALSSLVFQGSLSIKPVAGQTVPSTNLMNAMYQLTQSVSKHSYQTVTGDGTSNAELDMGQVSNCKFLMIQKPNQTNMKIRITHADGTNQIVPVGKFLVLECSEKPITAIDYTFSGDFEVIMGEW